MQYDLIGIMTCQCLKRRSILFMKQKLIDPALFHKKGIGVIEGDYTIKRGLI